MIQYSIYLQNFIYVVVGQIETALYTKCTKSAVMQHKTHEIST